MKANIQRSYDRLPNAEKERLKRFMEDAVNEQLFHEEAEMQKTWLQYACIILNQNFGFGETRCLSFLRGWKKMYTRNAKFKDGVEQSNYIDENISKIFKNGYPKEWVDSLEDI